MRTKKDLRNIIILRISLYITLLFFVSFFVYKGIVPSGKISYTKDFQNNSRFFTDLRPQDRLGEIENGTQNIIGDPIYFSLYTPRRFDKAELTIKYKTKNAPAVIEAGVLIDKENWRYALKPVYNKILNQLSLVWDNTDSNGVMLFQKEKKYNNIEEFLGNLPASEKIAVYNYDLKADYIINDYESVGDDSEKHIIPVSFEGDWQAYLYLKNEDLDIDFEFLKIKEDSGDVMVMLFYGETMIKKADEEQNLSAMNLPEGVYKLVVNNANNIVTKKISLRQEKIVFLPQIKIYNDAKESFDIFTDSKNVQITTVYSENLQTVTMNDGKFDINETYKQFEITRCPLGETEKATSSVNFAKLEFEKDGFSLSGDGVFAFNEESFFNPRIKKLDRNIDVIGDGIEYVIARYEIPKEDDAWQISNVEFDLKPAYREDGEYEFMISIPGLRVGDEKDDAVVVDEIIVEFFGKSFVDKIKEIYKFN